MAIVNVQSQLPGVFYTRPNSDADPFKKPGNAVAAADKIGLIKIMKSFQEVNAEADGKFVNYLVDNETSIEAGDPMAAIEI